MPIEPDPIIHAAEKAWLEDSEEPMLRDALEPVEINTLSQFRVMCLTEASRQNLEIPINKVFCHDDLSFMGIEKGNVCYGHFVNAFRSIRLTIKSFDNFQGIRAIEFLDDDMWIIKVQFDINHE